MSVSVRKESGVSTAAQRYWVYGRGGANAVIRVTANNRAWSPTRAGDARHGSAEVRAACPVSTYSHSFLFLLCTQTRALNKQIRRNTELPSPHYLTLIVIPVHILTVPQISRRSAATVVIRPVRSDVSIVRHSTIMDPPGALRRQVADASPPALCARHIEFSQCCRGGQVRHRPGTSWTRSHGTDCLLTVLSYVEG